ncbi:MAG: RecX family transcriptional regulator, partial [Lachnospiraceae bacterium]|nr:RecX family transcriptional regulator [Candidatus Hippenecus merdae]
MEISDEAYRRILEEVLLPRAKKRVLYYLKNADKTEFQIRRKLAEGLYPEEVIEKVMEFLHRYEFADDARYAESFIEAKKDG